MDVFLRFILLLPMIAILFVANLRDKPQRIFKGSDVPIADSAGTWESAATLPTQRYDFGAAVLHNSFYVVGGLVLPTPWLSTSRVEAYDSVSKRWKRIRNYPRVTHHPGVVSCDNHLFVLSGYWLRVMPSPHVYMYDDLLDQWIKRADIPVGRGALGAACMNGKIYVAGGERDEKQVSRLDVYDTKTDTWEEKAPMPTAREHFALVTANNKIFALGGLATSRFSTLDANEMYDPETNTWVQRAPLPHDIAGFSAAVRGDSIFIFGGLRGDATSAEVFEYKIAEDLWVRKADMPNALYGMVAGTINGEIHVVGGNSPVKGLFFSQDHFVFTP